MSLTTDQVQSFAAAIVEFVPEDLLTYTVERHEIVKDLDQITKIFSGNVEDRFRSIAEKLIQRYDAANLIPKLADDLYRQLLWQPAFLTFIGPYLSSDQDRRQAFIARRDNLFLASELTKALSENLPRICCIAGSYTLGGEQRSSVGTGFLVGSDLVLTAAHIFEPLVENEPALVPESFSVYFDHVEGAPITRPNDLREGVRKTRLAKEWLVAHSPSMQNDGRIRNPTAQEIEALRSRLDFALIRLEEKIGLEPIDASGGKLRAWIGLPHLAPANGLAVAQRITIPQHPFGEPRCIDFGRFLQTCVSGTRIRYDTETSKGTSGAPCFSRDFELVGVHNAEFNPLGMPRPEANQAILFDAIRPSVSAHLTESLASAVPSRIWNLSKKAGSFEVVLGRQVFLDWLNASMDRATPDRAHRLYAATSSFPTSGMTFTTEILGKGLANAAENISILFGEKHQLLPARLEDLVRAMAVAFKIPAAEIDLMPLRPDVLLPKGSIDGDKLRRWASISVPVWFSDLADRYRVGQIDRREEARKLRDQANLLQEPVSEAIQKIADSQAPDVIDHQRWNLAWIALDDLTAEGMTPEVMDFVAAMTGVGRDETALHPVLRRLRWLFLGHRPDFFAEGEITVEVFDPNFPDARDIQVFLESVAVAGRRVNVAGLQGFSDAVHAVIGAMDAGQLEPSMKMKAIQELSGRMLPRFLPGTGGDR